MVYGTSQEETFLGRDLGQGKGYSETTAAEIDGEMRDIIDEAYETCRRTLTEHIDQLHALAQGPDGTRKAQRAGVQHHYGRAAPCPRVEGCAMPDSRSRPCRLPSLWRPPSRPKLLNCRDR